MPIPLRSLPEGYAQYRQFILTTDRKLLLTLNIASLIPIVVMLIVMAVWQVLIGKLRAEGLFPPLPIQLEIVWWVGLILVFVLVLPFHELLHGLVIRAFGHPVKYGIKWEAGVIYAMSKESLFRRNEYLLVLLTPITVITLLGMMLNLFIPDHLAYTVSLGVILNAGGAIGDLWMVSVLLRFPSHVIVRDDADGFTLFDYGSSSESVQAGSIT